MSSSNESYDSVSATGSIFHAMLSRPPPKKRKVTPKQAIVRFRKSKVPAHAERTFNEKVNDAIHRLANVQLKFCASGKVDNAPLLAISTKKHNKRIVFPLYKNEFTDAIIKDFAQAPFGRGRLTVVDTNVRNSLQLNPKEFQILNKEWNSFLTKAVIPKIKAELQLDVTFKATLHKLLLYETGSFFKSHRDSEKQDGMFGTLVIQLPSRYSGGELVVRHNNKTETVDLSTKANPQNEFSVFYTAFYCDCEHEVLPLTDGYRVCLVYNLTTTGRSKDVVPNVDQIDQNMSAMNAFMDLLKEWPEPQKLVYCLTHKYSEKNLSFDKLKTTDKIVAKFLKNVADTCSLRIMVGTLEKEISGIVSYVGQEMDSDSEDNSTQYVMKNLQSLDNDKVNTFNSLSVDFKTEVIQVDCFDGIRAFNAKNQDTGNEGIEIEYSYRCAAIIMFRTDDLLPVLRRGGAKDQVVENLFLEFFNKPSTKKEDEKTQIKLLKWAKEVATLNTHKSNVFDLIASFENVELLKTYIKHKQFSDDFITIVIGVCEKYGWSNFTNELKALFGKLHDIDRKMTFFATLIGGEIKFINIDKLKTMHAIMEFFLNEKWFYGKNPLIALWPLASQIQFNIADFAKSKSIDFTVPVLIQLAEEHAAKGTMMNNDWFNVANYFRLKIEELTEVKLPEPTWQRNENLQCTDSVMCADCVEFTKFLRNGALDRINYEITQTRRTHLQNSISLINGLYSWATSTSLQVRKTFKENQTEFDEQQKAVKLLTKLRELYLKFSVKSEPIIKQEPVSDTF